MSVWNPDNVTDVAESIGIPSLPRDVVEHLARDVEYRMAQVVEEALKFMRHGKRTTLTTQDISQALRLLDVEPLYGYESTRPLRFGEASIGPGQPLFYVEDDEVDFEKLINAPLPKVPREISFTAHWLAVEGVQPTIPQNPTSADARNLELSAKGQGANPTLAALSGADNVSAKPLVKHVLSKELQLYFSRTCAAIFGSTTSEDYRMAALASLKTDPGLHQLLPYFIQFVADKITHNLTSLPTLTQSMLLVASLLENPSLYLAPYIPSLIPSILTCLLGKRLGSQDNSAPPTAHFALREYASSLLSSITRKYGATSSTLKPRLARSCLKHFLDSHKPLGTHYGALLGLTSVAGAEGVRAFILPNLKAYGEGVLENALREEGSTKREEAEYVIRAIERAGRLLDEDEISKEAVGDVVWEKLQESGGR